MQGEASVTTKKIYRGDRRNAAREAGTLSYWRHRARLRTGLYGWRKDKSGLAYKVYTYVVGA